MVRLIKNEHILDILSGNLSLIETLIPPNVDFGLKVKATPKQNISVGCVDGTSFSYVNGLLTDAFVNNYWINFSVGQFDIETLNYIPLYYDVIVFVNYTGYNSRKSNITDYLDNGGVIIGINATENTANTDFMDIFGLSSIVSSVGNFHFTEYGPEQDEIEKYFLGLGFDIITDFTIDSKKWGNWYIWEETRTVNITSFKTVDIESKRPSETELTNIPEGGFFTLENPIDNTNYTFKVKKVFWSDFVIIQAMNTSFIFQDFSEEGGAPSKDVIGKFNIIAKSGDDAEMTSNNTAIWISDFPESDEYRVLVKAAIASRVKEWTLKEPDLTKEYVAVSSFFPLCCDMPETVELAFYLWYKI